MWINFYLFSNTQENIGLWHEQPFCDAALKRNRSLCIKKVPAGDHVSLVIAHHTGQYESIVFHVKNRQLIDAFCAVYVNRTTNAHIPLNYSFPLGLFRFCYRDDRHNFVIGFSMNYTSIF